MRCNGGRWDSSSALSQHAFHFLPLLPIDTNDRSANAGHTKDMVLVLHDQPPGVVCIKG